MPPPKLFWSIQFTRGFQAAFHDLSDLDQWRAKGFIRNIVFMKNPPAVYNYTKCKKCPPDFYLFGISDDGLGNKGIEFQVWLHRKSNTLWFLKCKKRIKE